MTPFLRRTLVSLFATLLLAGAAQAAAPGVWPLAIPKGTAIIFKVPSKAIAFEKTSFWTEASSFTVNVEKSMTGLTVGGFPEWQDMGWASQLPLTLNKAEKKGGYFQVELDHDNGNHIKLRFMSSVTDVNGAMNQLVFVGNLEKFMASDYYRKDLANRFLPKVFTGPLAGIPFESQLKLFAAVKWDTGSIQHEIYKGKNYLVIRYSADEWTFNSNQINPPARVARTLQKNVMGPLKILYKAIANDAPDVNGIKIEWKIYFRDFYNEGSNVRHSDEMFVFSTMDQLGRFAEDEITNQQLIDNSVVLLNGDRVAVSLTQYD